jgi:small subunit ribosomal protein S4
MARYTGPKRKLERREKASLFGSNEWEKRPGNPGEHPFTRGRLSGYGVQLREVQKVKRIYGLLEKQFRKNIKNATHYTGNTGTRLLQLMELRLDNIVFRLGLAKTRAQARQFVNHGHIKVNGKKQSIPSYIVKVEDKIELKDKFAKRDIAKVIAEETKERNIPDWLDKSGNTGKLARVPKRAELDQSINERLIIEFYSR